MNKKTLIIGFSMVVILSWQSVSGQSWGDLLNQADLLSKDRNQDSAIVIGKVALERAEAQFGKGDTTVALVLHRLGGYSYLKTNYVEAESLYREALVIWESGVGVEHAAVANVLNDLARLYLDQDRYSESVPLCKRSLAIKEKLHGSYNLELVNTLDMLAEIFFIQDNSVEAEPLLKKALNIRLKTLSSDHPEVATNLHNLAKVYMNLGRYAEAKPHLDRCLHIREKNFGPDHPDVASSLMGLANYYMGLDKYAEAEPLYKRALTIQENTLGSEHRDLGALYHNYATVCKKLTRYKEAEEYYNKALSNFVKNRGLKHRYVSLSMAELAEIYTYQERYAEAESLYRQALDNLKSTLGMDHYNTLLCFESLSSYYRMRKETEKSLDYAWQDFEGRRKNCLKISALLSEAKALDYSERMRWSADNYLTCYLDAQNKNDNEIKRACDVVFSSKGAVSDGIFERRRSIAAEKDAATSEFGESLRLTKLQLSELFVQGPSTGNSEHYKAKLDSLSELVNQMESDLARRSASFSKNLARQNVSTERIASLLPHNSILVEYFQYDYLKLNPSSVIPYYLVVVMDQNGKPEILDLGEASMIDRMIAECRQHLTQVADKKSLLTESSTEEYKQLARRIYRKVWEPLEKYIKGKSLVFVAPDGGLNLLSFASLVDNQEKYLVEKYPLHYLSSGRDLIRLQDRQTISQGLLALGDPDYDAKPSVRIELYTQEKENLSLSAGMLATRNIRSGCEELKDIKVDRLLGTRREVEKIEKYWNLYNRYKALVLFGSQASEEMFKLKATGHRVIHLATHGYFLQGHCEPKGEKSFAEESFVGENPLLLSGLFLAGANLHGEGSDSVNAEDGILTADEVSALNLEGTQMVVLSACETGLGEVKQGEGVYGLRRAFQMAGARTVISALWKVPDLITAETMGELYKQKGKNIPERLRDMQLTQIRKLRNTGDPDHPYSWGAFIALGDWRY